VGGVTGSGAGPDTEPEVRQTPVDQAARTMPRPVRATSLALPLALSGALLLVSRGTQRTGSPGAVAPPAGDAASGRQPVRGVRVQHSDTGISTVTGFDDPPQGLVLAPGESAQAGLLWRDTTEFGEPVNAPYARVTVEPGADPVVVTPEFDLGTTGRPGVSAWQKQDGGPPPRMRP
jgi:Protein of unknown function (DUF4232)